MVDPKLRRSLLCTLPILALLSGCDMVVLSPSGYVAAQQADLLITSTLLMLIIIIPVMGLTAFFAWRYKASRRAKFDPDWHHSTSLELVIWAAPLLIIICLGALTWVSTHKLDPFRPLENIGERRPVPENVKPLEIQVVALDWKWLFIYPEYGIATVSEAAAPVDRPIQFHLTSTTVMNAFYVPALAGMIYAMPGMQSQLHAVMNYPGDYEGLSANFSGAGFSHMRFRFHGMEQGDFMAWVGQAERAGKTLDRQEFLALAQPSENVPPASYSSVDPELFDRIVNRCVEEGRMCANVMARYDAEGGTGLAGTINLMPAEGRSGSPFGGTPFYVADLCAPMPITGPTSGNSFALLAPIAPAPSGAAGETF
ncbi:MAG: ubiquinol oxidase subunit II [Rhodovulum sulfidophilum]|uniref:Ubiquinol oxidase subunit 2 n=1 Tax=Rhodovulum sulfidophilum TaxID=35806 RepID=A0A2W5Q337_RHOSU|nr:MAG: ubiquinol oxidase subunit II [Rhodovulum sulfidophilum]